MSNETNQVEVNEADAASNMASIAMKPTGISRTDLMAKMVDYAMKASKEDLASFVASIGSAEYNPASSTPAERFDSVEAAANATGDQSEKNKASIKSSGKHKDEMQKEPSAPMHPTMLAKESVEADLALLFGDSEDLTEDFKFKVSTLFEAAVSTRANLEISKIQEDFETRQAQLEEEFNTSLEEAITEIKDEMVENVDNYLNYAVAEWISENKLAIENNIRTQMAESFMASLKDVFTEHYVNIPEDQVDVVEAMAAELEEVKARLNETTEKNIELSKTVIENAIEEVKNEMSEGMTDTQKDKFLKLSEAVDYSDVEEFRKKVSIIKETYFTKSMTNEVKVAKDQLLSESVEEPEKVASIDPDMQVYVSSISKSLKK